MIGIPVIYYPPNAPERKDPVVVIVQVWLSASGEIENTAIIESGGSAFDREALRGERSASFESKIENCKGVRSTFLDKIVFSQPTNDDDNCDIEFRPATVVHIANIVLPTSFSVKDTAIVRVGVVVDEKGSASKVVITKSSGSDVIDNAAIDAAQRSTYTAEIDECKPVRANVNLGFSVSP